MISIRHRTLFLLLLGALLAGATSRFEGADIIVLGAFVANNGQASNGPNSGVLTLSAGTQTATVRANAKCVCGKLTNPANGVVCPVSGTVMTATGTGSDQISYVCL